MCAGEGQARGGAPLSHGDEQEEAGMGILQFLHAVLLHPDFEQPSLRASLRRELPYPCRF